MRGLVRGSDVDGGEGRAVGWVGGAPQGGLHETFNLGRGVGYSVRQAIAETGRIAGRDVAHTVGPRRAGDSPKLVGDIAKVGCALGWKPLRDLATQIEDTLRWRRKMPR